MHGLIPVCPDHGDGPIRALLACLALFAALGPLPAAAVIAGDARAIDGDTIDLEGVTLRLFGIDAPESAQTCGAADGAAWPCGAAASARLAALLDGREVACTARDRDRYGRIVATCAVDGGDIGAVLVEAGLAWAYVRYSDHYAAAEAGARAAGRGVWQGAATVAWDWRKTEGFRAAAGRDMGAPDADPTRADCAIKGNVNAKGERIYHTPASPWYARVRIDPARGKRWFCDAAEAEAAGWRPVASRR